jgi:chemosensory pili system protein ChpA (sensor histidine kinase/response regulator)
LTSPATAPVADFDRGPLAWVHVEIGHALERGLQLFAAFRAAPGELTVLRQARNQIHQAVGAIEMVGLDAVVAYTEELERQFGRIEQMPPADIERTCALIERACRKLAIFLDELVAGAAPVTLKLFPEYEAMQRLRGVKAAAATDLFFPDMRLRTPLPGVPLPVSEKKLAPHLLKQRRLYQNGLLGLLRGDGDGAKKMREAAAGLERVSAAESQRAFWWTVGAFFEAIVAGGLEPGFGAKQLAARLDLQIRRVVEGSVKVAARLRREVLYYVAVSTPLTPNVQAVQKAYGLSGLIPSAETLNADMIRLQPILHAMREELGTAKNIWLRVTLGRRDSLPKLRETLERVHESATAIGNKALTELTMALVNGLDAMPPNAAQSAELPEVFAMEYATGILLAESAVSNYGSLAANFPKQVVAMLARLDAARDSRPIPAGTAPLIDDIFRRAQERVLLAQVGREIQGNLRRMEQVLDAFFRDTSKRSEIPTLSKDSHQIRGAFQMLEQDAADHLLRLCEEQIDSYANPDTPVGEEDLELLAESLCGLGFFVEALQQQRSDSQRIIAPLLAKRLGEAPPEVELATETVEDAVEDLRAMLPKLVIEIRRAPTDPAARGALTAKLKDLVDDATLIDDVELVEQAQEALAELAALPEVLTEVETAGAEDAAPTVALEAAVTAIAESGVPVAAPAPEISAETQRLLATDANRLDAELLEIFLIEATEVLDTVLQNRAQLAQNPGDREALRSARRQFHTIKGSGRMVGLNELGELGYDVEKIHNRFLEEDRDVTPAMLELLDVAEANFRQWVGALQDMGDVYADPRALYAAIARVAAELPSEFEAEPLAPAEPQAAAPEPAIATTELAAATVPEVLVEHAQEEEEPAVPETMAFEVVESEFAAAEPAAPELEREPVSVDVPALESIDEEAVDAEAVDAEAVVDRAAADEVLASEAAPQAVDFVDAPAEDADADAEIIEFAPVGEMPAYAGAGDTIAAPPDVVTVGDVAIPADLYAVLVDEAQVHLATLMQELTLLQMDPRQPPSGAMVRASHTLCGIHRAGGFPLIALTAGSLEQCLLALQPLPLPTEALPALADAVGGLGEFLRRVKERRGFNATDAAIAAEIQEELDAVRQMVTPPPVVSDVGALGVEPPQIEFVDAELETPAAEAPAPADVEREPEVELEVEPELAASEEVKCEPEEVAAAEELLPTADANAGFEPETPAIEPEPDEIEEEIPAEAVAATLAEPLEEPARVEALAEAPAEAEISAEVAEPEEPARLEPGSREIAQPEIPVSIVPARAASIASEPVRREIPQDPLAAIRDDVDTQVLPIFLEEAAELYPQAGEQVRAWRRAPNDDARSRQLRRTLHTFKGSARMAGAMRLGELVHLMESRLDVDDAPVPGSADLFEALDGDLDRIAFVLDALREGKTNVGMPWVADKEEAVAEQRAPAQEAPVAPAEKPVVVPLPTPDHAPPRATAEAADVEGGARAMLRVRADIIDRLVNEAGEVAIARARIESELRALKANLLELTGSVIRLRTQVREIEIQAESQIQSRLMQVGEGEEGFDPLEFDRYTRFQELARSLGEGVNDVSTVQQSLLKNLDVADAALSVQGRLARDVQQQLFSIRTVPFGSLSERLYRILRVTARELGKRANLEIRGTQTELDRAVLEKLVGPLEHLLRNALDHGIEPRAQRIKAGKSETGEITLTVRQVANEIAIELADDGAGLNLEGVRAKAVAQGRIAPDAHPSEVALIECIFQPGFSTASKVTQVSGRGIGMDVVRSEIMTLGGRVEVATRAGSGTTFHLYLPLTLAVAQAVMVRAGGRLWALPAPMVEHVQHVKADVLVDMYVRRRVEHEGQSYPFHYLPRLLGDPNQIPESSRNNPVLLLRSGQHVAAIHVDEMIGNQEVVVKNIGPQLARVSGIAGATVLGNGEVVLIINPVQLAQRVDVPEFDPDAERVAPEVPKMAVVQAERPLVMIVDDSLTVRRITSKLLTREGFDVLTARDGVDALALLETEMPDVILLDIEMPRMDGFEFTKNIKATERTAQIPIVMITSRTAEKHRNLAKDLGVDLYLGKPFQEEELLRHLRDMLALTT